MVSKPTNTPLLEAAEVRILRLQPGDEIILSITDRHVTRELIDSIRAQAEERWPDHRVTVLGNVEMEVKREEADAGRQ